MIRKGFYLVLVILLFVRPASADQRKQVETLLKSKVDAVLKVLEKKSPDQARKNKKIMEIVGPVIDFDLMAKLTLGRSNWSRLDKAQQAEFIDLFVKRLKASYLDKSSLYCCQKIDYKPARQRGSKVYVPMEVAAKNRNIEVLYKFYSSEAGWRVYDVEIQGVSLVKSYRSQFDEILKNGTVDDLFAELKKVPAK